MQRVALGRIGVEVSAVSLGTWAHGGPNKAGHVSVGWTGHDDGLALRALRRAVDVGIDHWDTADVYGNGHAEALIGRLWGELGRDRVFLASKVGWDRGPYPHYYDCGHMRAQLVRSLTNLKTDVIDLYYLHHCDFGRTDEHFDGALETVRRFQEEGKIRFVGLSDWNLPRIMRFIDRVDPDVVQPYRNVAEDDYSASGLKAWIEHHHRGVAFFSPIKHGLLLGKYSAPQSFPVGDFRRNVRDFGDAARIAKLAENRRRLEGRFGAGDKGVLRGLLGALLSDAPTGCVLLGMRSPAQVKAVSDLDVSLSIEDAEWVRGLYRET